MNSNTKDTSGQFSMFRTQTHARTQSSDERTHACTHARTHARTHTHTHTHTPLKEANASEIHLIFAKATLLIQSFGIPGDGQSHDFRSCAVTPCRTSVCITSKGAECFASTTAPQSQQPASSSSSDIPLPRCKQRMYRRTVRPQRPVPSP